MTMTQKRTTRMRIIIIMSNEDENDWTGIRVNEEDKMTYDTSTTMRRQWRRGARTLEKDERKNNE